MKNQHGLTLIELIIVVAIIGIMASLATPDFGSMMQRSKLKTSYNTFAGVISTARAEAVNQASTIVVCVSTNGTSCVADNTKIWSDGYLAFLDANGNQTVDSAERILRYEPATVGLIIRSDTHATSISVFPRGRLNSAGTFVFCSNANAEASAKALNLWVTGLGRLATDDDGDSFVDDINNNPISCT